MKIISYCLYGKKDIYNKGAIINCTIAKEIYPEWEIWIYISSPSDIQESVYNELLSMNNVKIIDMNDLDKSMGLMLWRYIPAFCINNVELFITRDLDSRLDNKRDIYAVKKWIESDCKFHIIRDHPAHSKIHIMGGIWGVKGGLLKYKTIFEKYLEECKIDGIYKNSIMSEKAFRTLFETQKRGINFDQYFLKLFLYEKVISNSYIHLSDASFNKYPNTKGLKNIDINKCKKWEIIPSDIKDKEIGSKGI